MMPGGKVAKHNSSDTPRSAMAAAEAATVADSSTTTTLDSTVFKAWSPNRNSHRPIRVHSLEDGNIRGEHWVLNRDGRAATIAFLWKNTSGLIHGLTTGRNKHQGDAVFVFLHCEPTETPESYCYELLEIGEVVSLNEATDSALFQVTRDDVKNQFDLP